MSPTNIQLPSNKKFGYFFSFIFLLVSIYFLYVKNHSIGYIFLILMIIFFITTLTNAKLLLPFNKLWMNFGLLLGKIISPIVLGLIFFILFTTYAIIMRIMGRDELNLKKSRSQSYWKHQNKHSNHTNFKQQY